MVRRSTPQSKVDESAFPVRVFIVVPEMGFGRDLNQLMTWMGANWDRGTWATHSGGRGVAEGGIVYRMALYVRRPEQAVAVLAAFPKLQLADGTQSVCYTSPMR